MTFHEPDLEEVLAHGVAGAELERFVKPSILINRLLLLNEDRSQLAIRRETPDGRVVEVLSFSRIHWHMSATRVWSIS